MAAGLTEHVWTLREVLLCRVPPCLHIPPNVAHLKGAVQGGQLRLTAPAAREARRRSVTPEAGWLAYPSCCRQPRRCPGATRPLQFPAQTGPCPQVAPAERDDFYPLRWCS